MDDKKPDLEIKDLLLENKKLLLENNQLLQQLHRNTIISSVFRVVWFVLIIVLLMFFYFNYKN
jgi:cytochrome c biogenesis protein ResB